MKDKILPDNTNTETKTFKTWSDYSNWFIQTHPDLYDRVSDSFVINNTENENFQVSQS